MKEYYISVTSKKGYVINSMVVEGYESAYDLYRALLESVKDEIVVDLIDYETAEVIETNYDFEG